MSLHFNITKLMTLSRLMIRRVFQYLFVAGILSLVACLPPPSQGAGASESADFASFVFQTVTFFLLIFFVYFFLIVRPSVVKEDGQKKFLDSLKKNSEVMLSGGIFGRVYSISEDFITVEVARDVRLKVHPQYVASPPESKKPAAQNTSEEDSK